MKNRIMIKYLPKVLARLGAPTTPKHRRDAMVKEGEKDFAAGEEDHLNGDYFSPSFRMTLTSYLSCIMNETILK